MYVCMHAYGGRAHTHMHIHIIWLDIKLSATVENTRIFKAEVQAKVTTPYGQDW